MRNGDIYPLWLVIKERRQSGTTLQRNMPLAEIDYLYADVGDN